MNSNTEANTETANIEAANIETANIEAVNTEAANIDQVPWDQLLTNTNPKLWTNTDNSQSLTASSSKPWTRASAKDNEESLLKESPGSGEGFEPSEDDFDLSIKRGHPLFSHQKEFEWLDKKDFATRIRFYMAKYGARLIDAAACQVMRMFECEGGFSRVSKELVLEYYTQSQVALNAGLANRTILLSDVLDVPSGVHISMLCHVLIEYIQYRYGNKFVGISQTHSGSMGSWNVLLAAAGMHIRFTMAIYEDFETSTFRVLFTRQDRNGWALGHILNKQFKDVIQQIPHISYDEYISSGASIDEIVCHSRSGKPRQDAATIPPAELSFSERELQQYTKNTIGNIKAGFDHFAFLVGELNDPRISVLYIQNGVVAHLLDFAITRSAYMRYYRIQAYIGLLVLASNENSKPLLVAELNRSTIDGKTLYAILKWHIDQAEESAELDQYAIECICSAQVEIQILRKLTLALY